MAAHVLIGAGVVVLWLASLYFKPFGRCPACWGGRVRTGKRTRKCRLCKGRGRHQRLGSRTVHRIRRQVTAHWRGAR
jgi:hypothetical protein